MHKKKKKNSIYQAECELKINTEILITDIVRVLSFINVVYFCSLSTDYIKI